MLVKQSFHRYICYRKGLSEWQPIMTILKLYQVPLYTHHFYFTNNILTIFDIYKLQLGILIYCSTNNIGPSHDIVRYTRAIEIHSHATRYAHHNSFFQNYSRTTRYGLKSLQIEGTHLWSIIPLNIREAPSKNVFKNHYKKTLLDMYV